MSWVKRILGIEEMERLEQEQALEQREAQQANMKLVLSMAEKSGIQMAQCPGGEHWYVARKGQWCDCQ